MLKHVGRWTTLALIATFSAPALAAYHWDFANSTGTASIAPALNCAPTKTNTYGNCGTWNSTPGGGPSVNVTGFSNNGTSNSILAAYVGLNPGGLGVVNSTEATSTNPVPSVSQPNHAIDNSGTTDSTLLTFTTKVNLTGVAIGWPPAGTTCSGVACDTDISIWAYTGASSTPLGLTYGTLVSNGWTLVGSYGNLGQNTYELVNGALSLGAAGLVNAQYWLISAYNAAGGATLNGKSVDGGNDYVKLESVYAVTPGKVPEPGSLVLLLVAAAGGAWVRRAKPV
jgi:hypothetical protein